MRNVILFHYCKCGACDATVVSIPQFDLLCLNSRFKFVGLEDDGIMLEEVERSDSCHVCRSTDSIAGIRVTETQKKLFEFDNARRPRLRIGEYLILYEFVKHLHKA